MNRALGFGALVLTTMLFGTFGLFTRILSRELSVFQQLSYRYTIGTVILLVVLGLSGKRRPRLRKFGDRQALGFAVWSSCSVYLAIRAYLETKLSIATSAFYAGTLLSAFVIGRLRLWEKVSARQIGSLVLMGLALALFNNLDVGGIADAGLVFGLAAGCCYSMANLVKKEAVGFSKMELLLIMSVAIAVSMHTLSFLSGDAVVWRLGTGSILALLALILLVLAAEALSIVGFRNSSLYHASLTLCLDIVFTTLVGMVFLREYPSGLEWAGIGLILAAILATNLPPAKAGAVCPLPGAGAPSLAK